MSQIAVLANGIGPVGPQVATLTGNSGGAVGADALFNINILGGTGITAVGTPLTNTITLSVNSLLTGSGTTIGAVTADLITLPMGATQGMRLAQVMIEGYEITGPSGCGYNLICGCRTTGAAATIVGAQDKYISEDAAIVAADGNFVVAANNLIVQVTGVAGLTLNWKAALTYVGV